LISQNSSTQLAIPLHRLIEGFLLSCKVENKSPKTITFFYIEQQEQQSGLLAGHQ